MKNSRPILIKLAGAAAVFGVVFAMAATLGVSSDTLGAGDQTVASCDTDGVTAAYDPVWDAVSEIYEVPSVTVGGIATACEGKAIKVTLVDSAGASLGEVTGTVPSDLLNLVTPSATTLTLASGASAEAVSGVHVVIAD